VSRKGSKQNGGRSHDGYRIHKNPDGTYVFIEGLKGSRELLTREELTNFKACLKRRGLPPIRYK
jgi:hypothetical protein